MWCTPWSIRGIRAINVWIYLHNRCVENSQGKKNKIIKPHGVSQCRERTGGKKTKKKHGAEKHKHLRGHKARARIWSVLFCSKYTKEGSDVCSTVMLQRRQRKVYLVCRSLLNLAHLLKVTQGHLKDTLAQVLPLGESSIKNVCHAWASGVKYFTLPRGGSRGGRRWSAWIHLYKSIWIFNWSERGPVPLFLVWSERKKGQKKHSKFSLANNLNTGGFPGIIVCGLMCECHELSRKNSIR